MQANVSLGEKSLLEEVERSVQSSPNPDLAKLILFKMHYESPEWSSNTVLAELIGVPQGEVNGVLPSLSESGLVKLKTESEQILNVRRVEDVRTYLESDIPYGQHRLIEEKNLSDNQLLRAMNSVASDIVFIYSKRVELPLNELREIRDESHKTLGVLRRQEKDKIYRRIGIKRNWIRGLPSFVSTNDNLKLLAYDVNWFNFYGKFASPADALKENFSNADADSPIDDKGKFGRVKMISISRCGEEANSLTLHNSRYYAAEGRDFDYQRKLEKILPEIQGNLEKALES